MDHGDATLLEPFIPHDVALMVLRGNMPLAKAWRLRLNMSVEEVATAAGLLPSDIAQIEARENVLSRSLFPLAQAMNLEVDQLVDIAN